MKKPNPSKDYQRLKELLDAENEIVCYVDLFFEKVECIASKKDSCYTITDNGAINIVCNCIAPDNNPYSLISLCKEYKVEFIDTLQL